MYMHFNELSSNRPTFQQSLFSGCRPHDRRLADVV